MKYNFHLLRGKKAEINYVTNCLVHCVHFSWVMS